MTINSRFVLFAVLIKLYFAALTSYGEREALMRLFRFHILVVFLFLGVCFFGKLRASSFYPLHHHHVSVVHTDTGKDRLAAGKRQHHAGFCLLSDGEGIDDDTLVSAPRYLPIQTLGTLLSFYHSLLPAAPETVRDKDRLDFVPETIRPVPYYILFHTIIIPDSIV
jgi:hypothetical protein